LVVGPRFRVVVLSGIRGKPAVPGFEITIGTQVWKPYMYQPLLPFSYDRPASVVEPKGVVFTKPWVVELLLDLAGYSYPFGRTILAWRGSVAPGPRVTWFRENHRRAMSSGPGPYATRFRENHHGWDRTANEPPVASGLVAWTIPTAAEGQLFRRPILSAARRQRRHVLLLEEACP